MKKLMTVVSVAATLLAFGAVNGDEVRTFTNTGFEDDPPYTAGELLSTTNDDTGKVAGAPGFAATWVALPEGDESEHKILAYDAEGAEAKPTGFSEVVDSQYLHVESSTNMLQRNVQPGGAAASIGDGIYLDTLVKFSPADKLFEASDITTGDKIAITYVGEDATEVENPISNIVVYAGYVDGSTIVPTNYVMNLPDNADFDLNAWHRLTVRSIANVGSSVAPVGFAIYIDGNPKPLTYASDVAAGDSAYEGALNAAVRTYLYNGTKHALLPSLVDSTYNGYNELTTVGFKGTGSIDNLAFTAKPGFIEEGTAVEIAWDEGVATYTVVDNENNTLVDGAVTGGEAGSTNLLLEVGITNLTVTATYGTGYEPGTWTVTGDGAAISGGTFTVADGAKLNINSMTPKFDVGGVHYGTFAEALDAAVAAGTAQNPATIKLLADVSETIAFTEGDIVLDLNGNTIYGGANARFVVANSGANLTIVDSATGGTVKSGTTGSVRVYGDTAFTTIEAGKYEGTIVVTGQDEVQPKQVLVITGGKFYDEDYEEDPSEAVFYLTPYVDAATHTITGPDENFYFTVSSSEEPPTPTTVEVPTAVTGLVYDGTEKTGVVAATGYTLTGNIATNAGNYTATATLEQGYVWSDTTTEAKSINWSIAVNDSATVDLTLSSEIAEWTDQLEFPTVTAKVGTEDVTGEPVWDPAKISEPDAGTTNTYTVTFTVMNGGYTGSTGTATFKVWKAASGGEDWPTDPATVSGETAADAFGISGDLANADAGVLATWAKANSVDYSDRTTAILTDAFLLNCANTQEAVDAAKANFKVTAITVVGDTVTITPADAADYGNGKIVIEGAAALTSPMSWHAKTTGDHFFRATLVVKPVTP